ncbi:hypothetical protein [Streptomyces caelestis]|uniref:hypothetical protein n=1 Tax=Streptomyces caelestis TaxID=36816 RepID=UPI00364BA7F0
MADRTWPSGTPPTSGPLDEKFGETDRQTETSFRAHKQAVIVAGTPGAGNLRGAEVLAAMSGSACCSEPRRHYDRERAGAGDTPDSSGRMPSASAHDAEEPSVITQGVQVTGRCGVCGGTTTCDVGQFFDRDVLCWGTEGRCADCPNGWCEQDSGPVTPESVRQALLEAYGPVRLRLSGDAPNLAPVLQALRGARRLSLGEARAQAAELSGTDLIGTLVEMEFLAVHLRRRAVSVVVQPAA